MVSCAGRICADDPCIAFTDNFDMMDGRYVHRWPVGVDSIDEQIISTKHVIENIIILFNGTVIDNYLCVGGKQYRPIDSIILTVKNDGLFSVYLISIRKTTLNGRAVAGIKKQIILYIKRH